MSQILNAGNIQFMPEMARDNEVVLGIDCMVQTIYILSPKLALELAAQLEAEARKVIEKQQLALRDFEARKE